VNRKDLRYLRLVVPLSTFVITSCATAAAAPPAPTPVSPTQLATVAPAKPARTAPSPVGSGPQIGIENFNFVPAEITVPVGTTVTWTNHDDVPHTSTSSDQVWDSKTLDPDGSYSFTFDKPGTYSYFCAVHPFMTARVVVQ